MDGLLQGVGVKSGVDEGMKFFSQDVQVAAVGTVEAVVVGLLVEDYLHLGHLVVLIAVVVVQMLLIQVEYNANMRATVYILQLVAGKFGHGDGLFVQLGEYVEKGDADIAGKNNVVTRKNKNGTSLNRIIQS